MRSLPFNVECPKRELKHRAQKHIPDPYYVNQNIKKYPGFGKDYYNNSNLLLFHE
jgi:hypothetical protein